MRSVWTATRSTTITPQVMPSSTPSIFSVSFRRRTRAYRPVTLGRTRHRPRICSRPITSRLDRTRRMLPPFWPSHRNASPTTDPTACRSALMDHRHTCRVRAPISKRHFSRVGLCSDPVVSAVWRWRRAPHCSAPVRSALSSGVSFAARRQHRSLVSRDSPHSCAMRLAACSNSARGCSPS